MCGCQVDPRSLQTGPFCRVSFLREVNFKNQRSFFRYFAFEEDVFVAECQFLLLTELQFIGVTLFGFSFVLKFIYM